MNITQALEIVGGLSLPSKMPCQSYSIPAKYCITGAVLAKVAKSICSKCYALKGFYRMPNVKNCLEKRFQSLTNPRWVEAMTVSIDQTESSGYFRWHDSGDLQSVEHLEKIAEICARLPHIQFWLPTREYVFVSRFRRMHEVPQNLNIRLSALMIDGPAPTTIAKRLGLTTSGVSANSFDCPASKQGNKCLTCRACWDKSIQNINYKLH